jgi:hypothetical protein
MKTEVTTFPFRKLSDEKFIVVDIMMFLKYDYATEFMFNINKIMRKFIKDNFITI